MSDEVKPVETVQPVQKKISRNSKIVIGSIAALLVAAGGFVIYKIRSKAATTEA